MTECPDVQSVAVLGAGAMGAPIARRLIAAGFKVTVCDRNAAALLEFGDSAAGRGTSASVCATSDLVLAVVATTAQLRDAVWGDDGLLSSPSAARPQIMAVMSTVGPQEILRLHTDLADSGVEVVDAPISGGVQGAHAGTLSIMLGGPAATLARIGDVLNVLGTSHVHCGGVGQAQTAKVLNNVIGVTNAFLAAEVFTLATERGLEVETMAQVLEVSSGRNFLSAEPSAVADTFRSWAQSRSDFEDLTAIMAKDLQLGIELSAASPTGMVNSLQEIIAAQRDDAYLLWRQLGVATETADTAARDDNVGFGDC